MTGPAAEERRGPIMRLDVVTVFPDYLAPLRLALLGRAVDRGIIEVGVHDLRAWTHDVHKSVDDTPFGGGPGMVMRPTVWGDALDDLVPQTDTGLTTGPAASASCRISASPAPRSAATKTASPPAARISATTASPRSVLRPVTTTDAPSAARACAMATPRPPVEPVTSAVRPVSRVLFGLMSPYVGR